MLAPQIFLPTPYTGFKAIRAGLLADTFLEAHAVEHMKKRYVDFVLTEEEAEVVNRLKNGTRLPRARAGTRAWARHDVVAHLFRAPTDGPNAVLVPGLIACYRG